MAIYGNTNMKGKRANVGFPTFVWKYLEEQSMKDGRVISNLITKIVTDKAIEDNSKALNKEPVINKAPQSNDPAANILKALNKSKEESLLKEAKLKEE